MRYIKYISAILLAFLLHKVISYGETNIFTILLIFLALGLYCYGTIFLAYALTNDLIPLEEEKYQNLRTSRKSRAILEKTSRPARLKRTKQQKASTIILITVFIFGFASIYGYWLDKLTNNEIQNNLVEKMVVIKSISWAKGRYADFEFEYNGLQHWDRTRDDNLEIGDTIKIHFSSNNPRILRVNNYP